MAGPEDQPRQKTQHSRALFVDAEFQDFDHVAEAIQGWDLDWRQLDRGGLEASLQQIGTRSVLLTRVGFSRQFHQRGGTPPDFLTVGLVGKEVEGVKWCGRRVTADDLLVFRSGGEYESMSLPGFRCSTVSFSAELLSRLAGPRELAQSEPLLSDSTRVVTCAPSALEYAFREQLGVTPKQYLKSVRLAGARSNLLRSETGDRVADVANHWGFWHMGQFASDYRRQFGELPSETLARR